MTSEDVAANNLQFLWVGEFRSAALFSQPKETVLPQVPEVHMCERIGHWIVRWNTGTSSFICVGLLLLSCALSHQFR
ncbi:unnamed protein product [Calypogeia fissa]